MVLLFVLISVLLIQAKKYVENTFSHLLLHYSIYYYFTETDGFDHQHTLPTPITTEGNREGSHPYSAATMILICH